VERRIRELARDEAVQHLDDLMLRRTEWGADPRNARRLGVRVAQMMGWSGGRAEEELARLDRESA
jgi:glycerol-3-phosphate dehydrogenase